MAKDILCTIIEVEREIQERLVAEQRQADERLAQLRRECAEEEAREEARLAKELAEATAAPRVVDAHKQAVALVAAATARAERLGRLGDESLRRCIRRELFRIVPGKTS